VKVRSDGIPKKNKACLVAKGYQQVVGIDFEDTFAPLVKWATIQTIIVLAKMNDWEIKQLDIKTTFLN